MVGGAIPAHHLAREPGLSAHPSPVLSALKLEKRTSLQKEGLQVERDRTMCEDPDLYHVDMAYDEDLAERIRELVAGQRGVTEMKMFGGLGFLIGGNMAVAASGQGGLLVRVDPEMSDELIDTTTATPMVMRGRPMQGWLRVEDADVRTKRQLSKWVKIGTAYASSLPPKKPKKRR